MPKRRRRTPYCLNCGEPLGEEVNYCPNCGQENDVKRLAIGSIISNFFQEQLFFDSKFFRSLRYFLFFPGHLTNEFTRGRRIRYITPVRLYLFTSFAYFLILSLSTFIDSSPLMGEEEELGGMAYVDSVGMEREGEGDTMNKERGRIGVPWGDKDLGPPKKFVADVNRKGMDRVLDSLGIEKFFPRLFVRQSYKVYKRGKSGFIQKMGKDVSVMMFFLMPLFALLLKVFFWKNRMFYIEHLIHALHLHAFIFFLLLIGGILQWVIPSDGLFLVGSVIALVYWGASLRNVYKRKFISLAFKLLFLLTTYSLVFAVAFLVTLMVSILTI